VCVCVWYLDEYSKEDHRQMCCKDRMWNWLTIMTNGSAEHLDLLPELVTL
jgi:hypothetical protein